MTDPYSINSKNCGNCRSAMRFLKREHLQLGRTGWILGDLPNMIAGALDVEIWYCPTCGKLDFYRSSSDDFVEDSEDSMAHTVCPVCGREHDLDDPKCPFCGAKNPRI